MRRSLSYIPWLAIAVIGAGCSGTVSLKRSVKFTPSKVKAIQYDDACHLQAYFDQRPPPPVELQSTMLSVGSDKGASGQVTLQLKPGLQQRTFRRLLRRFYEPDDRLPSGHALRVTVPFFEPTSGGDRRQLPIGAVVEVHGSKGPIPLSYHPCLGDFFFGERVYEARRAVFGPKVSNPSRRRGARDPYRPSFPK